MPVCDNNNDDDDDDDDDDDHKSAILSSKQIRCILHPNWPLSESFSQI